MTSGILCHSGSFWGPGEYATAIAIVLLVGLVAVAVLAGVSAYVRRRSAGRRPCPSCGRFLGAGERCPVCRSDGTEP
jgi:hypothetical protein